MMVWKNPPKFIPTELKVGKLITPEMVAGKSEGSQQKALMIWAALNIDKYPQLKWLFHIPNGGTRNIREAVELKAQGVKAGVPDLMLPYWGYTIKQDRPYFGLFIELKAEERRKEKHGGLSKEQDSWLANLYHSGYYVAVCYGWLEARDVIINYLEGKL